MRPYYHNNAILFSVVLVVIISLFYIESASAFCKACDDCLAACQGYDGCCTGTGCMCEDECNSCPCPPCFEQKWYCGPIGDCWPYCQAVGGPNFPSTIYYFFDPASIPLNPVFTWDIVSDANSYDAQICSNSDCSSIVLTTSSKINAWQVVSGLNPNTTYWFRVRSVNSCGNGSWGFFPMGLTTSTCRYSLLPQANAYSPQGATGTVTVKTSLFCPWTAKANEGWITITSGSSGTGNGTVSYSVSANNTGAGRIGSLTIGGQGFYVMQVNSTFADDPQNVFTPYINAIYEEGITVGCGNGDYCPSMLVTRGQMAAFIIRSIYGENFSYTMEPYFSDVPSNHTFFKYVQKMKDAGITAVTGTYNVDGTVPREQMAAFLVRAVEGEPPDNYCDSGSLFPDVTPDMWSCRYIKRLKELGITKGYQDGRYGPYDLVPRDQMAAFLARAFLWME